MAYDPRTGIQSFAQADPSADVNAAIDVPEAVAPSTATAFAPKLKPAVSFDDLFASYFPNAAEQERMRQEQLYDWYKPPSDRDRGMQLADSAARSGNLEDWLYALDFRMQEPAQYDDWGMQTRAPGGGYDDIRYGYLGEDMVRGPLDQIAGAAGVEGVDWAPYLDQYWLSEFQDQTAHGRKPLDIFSHRQGFGDTLLGVSDLAGFGDLAAQNVGPGTDFYEQYNTLPNWVESQRDSARNSRAAGVVAMLAAGLLAPYISTAMTPSAGATAGSTVAAGAMTGGLTGLLTGDPFGGAVRGGVSAFGSGVAAPAAAEAVGADAEGMLSRMGFSGDAQFGGVGLDDAKRVSTATAMPAAIPEVDPTFGGALSQIGPGAYGQFSGMMPPAIPEAPADLAQMGLTQTAPGVWERMGAAGMIPSTSPSYDPAAPDIDVQAQEPSLLDKAGRYLKLGRALANLGGGEGAPQDAPQREEGQSDADFVQSLAAYVNVDAGALAEMGLTPGTPQYYEYLMGQMDNTLAGYEDAADLMGQLRGKTQDELTNLRRALYVRGQLDQLMGSGTYTDPFTGLGEEVIDAGGAGINPGMAAYQRGLGRSIEGFAGLDQTARREEIGSFLDRAPDLYGVQGRMDARSEREAMVQAFLEDLKRRQGGMLRGAPQFWE
jgi:hypothetical protein